MTHRSYRVDASIHTHAMSARIPDAFLILSHVMFLRERVDKQPVLGTDALEIRRLLLQRLEMLEAALMMLANLRDKAASTLTDSAVHIHKAGRKPMSPQASQDLLRTLRATLLKIDADPAPSRLIIELRLILAARIARLEYGTHRVRKRPS